ncbi:MAG: KEOPS complex kinase/ATPase Bud32 [Candidatus Micrarchaeia archaeon]|jgi:Kae1-associated kinase Bud32
MEVRQIGFGAEAVVYSFNAFGRKLVIKYRKRKDYREKTLDDNLRKKRTNLEASILKKLEGIVDVPKVFIQTQHSIIMSFEKGKSLLEIKGKERRVYLKKAGEALAKIHKLGIVHGDFTPANILVEKRKVKVIDFGLAQFSNSIEEKAMDLLLMKRAIGKKEFNYFLKGYNTSEKEEIIKKMREIESRARYVERRWF